MSTEKNYNSLDLVKFLMAIVVIAIHTHPFEHFSIINNSKFYSLLRNIAVPFFFISSGYLTFLKSDGDLYTFLDKLYLTIIKYVKLYIIWTVIYLPITIYDFIVNDDGVIQSILSFVRGFLLIGENFYSWPLWFLLSSIYSYLVIFLLIKLRKKISFILIFSIAIFIASIGIDIIVSLDSTSNFIINIQNLIHYTFAKGRLFTGMAYISIGMLFAIKDYIKNIALNIILLISGTLLWVFIDIFNIRIISLLLIVPALFSVIQNIRINSDKVSYYLRKSSTVMYFSHMIIFFLYTVIFKSMRYYGLDAFIFTLIGTLILSVFVNYQYKKTSFLKSIF